jgi:hypothetical protein
MDPNRPSLNPQAPSQAGGNGGGVQQMPAAPAKPVAPGIILPPQPQQNAAAGGTAGGGTAGVGMAGGGMTKPPVSKIQHTKPGFGPMGGAAVGNASEEVIRSAPRLGEDAKPLPVAESSGLSNFGGKITAFGKEKRHEDQWSRTPNTTGNGAIHVKTFHCKLTDDALAYLDQSINEWLDAHPQYEVKFVSSSIGMLTGKLKEPALICQVWV